MSEVDLHLHSTASDGRFSPAEIVQKAAANGLTVIAIADHDSVDGIPEALAAAKAFPQLKVIPAVELSTDVPQGEVHILGYFIDYASQKLKRTLEQMRHSRLERAQGMVTKLGELGIHITFKRVKEIAGSGAFGRPHIAQAMLEKGYISSIKEAFIKYIGRDGPAYVERKKITPLQATEVVIQANGLPVMGHPLTTSEPEQLVVKLKEAGLVGIEAYYDGYSTDDKEWLKNLASKYNLITTGGSDYHGLDETNETLIGGVEVPLQAAEQLITLAQKRAPKLVS